MTFLLDPAGGSPGIVPGRARLARRLGGDLGMDVQGAATGGASDANFVAAQGTPVLDGVGPIGGGDHTPGEWLDLDSVPERVALLCGLILGGPAAVAAA